jgi:hypothetical protein
MTIVTIPFSADMRDWGSAVGLGRAAIQLKASIRIWQLYPSEPSQRSEVGLIGFGLVTVG